MHVLVFYPLLNYVLFENVFLYSAGICVKCLVVLVTFIMPVIYPLFIAVVVVSCLCV